MNTKVKVVPVQLTDAMRAATTHAESFDEAWSLALAAIPAPTKAEAEPVGVVAHRKGDKFELFEGVIFATAILSGDVEDGTKLYTHAKAVEVEHCYEHALTAMEGEADRLRAQIKRDSAEAAELQSYLVGTARTIRPVDGSGLFAWALAALKAQAVAS